MSKSEMMTLPIKYGNRALAKEEALDCLIEKKLVDVWDVIGAVDGNAAYSKILKEAYKRELQK